MSLKEDNHAPHPPLPGDAGAWSTLRFWPLLPGKAGPSHWLTPRPPFPATWPPLATTTANACYRQSGSLPDPFSTPWTWPSFGDPILVSTGVYTGVSARPGTGGVVTQVVHITRTVQIQGGYAPGYATWDPVAYPTTLDACGLGRVVYATGDITPSVVSLRITGGSAAGQGGGTGGRCGRRCVSARRQRDDQRLPRHDQHRHGLGVGGGLYASGGAPILATTAVQRQLGQRWRRRSLSVH